MHRGLGDDSRIHKINEEYLNANASTNSTATGYTNTDLQLNLWEKNLRNHHSLAKTNKPPHAPEFRILLGLLHQVL